MFNYIVASLLVIGFIAVVVTGFMFIVSVFKRLNELDNNG